MGLRGEIRLTIAGNAPRSWATLLLMVASGFAGLGYQLVWAQQCALWLGHEAAAVLAVLSAFFGGISLGAWLLGGRIERSLRPRRWYAGCELACALWSGLLSALMPPISGILLRWTGEQPSPLWQWSLAFGGTFCLLLPATAAMGATLPAMQRIRAELAGDGRSIAVLYAGNTLGALLGVLAVAFVLIPRLGLTRSALLCAALNLLCAGTALRVLPARVEIVARAQAGESVRARRTLGRLALSGLLGIGYEVLVVRVLSQVTESTVYTFALLLAVYLVGSALGAASYHRFRLGPRGLLEETLFGLLAAACLLGAISLWAAESLKALALGVLGPGVNAALLAEAFPALCAFGPATVAMGALFSELARSAERAGVGFGTALAVNTLGAAAAPGLFGVLVLPALGPKLALISISVGYLLPSARRSWHRPLVWLPASLALALGLWAPPLAFVDVPAGGRVLRYEDGVMAAVSVVEDADGVARLRIDNRAQEGSSRSQRVDSRQAWLPLLLHPGPRSALFLGLGTGVTAASAAQDPTLRVDAVELLPEVIRAAALFAPSVADGAGFKRLHVLSADARRYVRVSQRRYDVIVSDNFHPARSGSGSLYTVQHFQAVRERLAQGGLFCQWLPLHQLDRESLRSIVRSFLAVYPAATALTANNSLETPVLGLVGRRSSEPFDVSAVQRRLASVALPERVQALGLEDELAVLGSFIAGPAALGRFAATAELNTDDHPLVAYRAPLITYAPDSSPAERLSGLLRELGIEPAELLRSTPDARFAPRLAAYWLARNRFVESGRNVRPSPRVEEMLSQVQGPLLAVLRLSPDFRPAYDPLLAMATALARSNVSAARALLAELTRIQPARSEAPQALAALGASAR